MNRITLLFILLMSVFAIYSCDTNKVLRQDSVDSAIKEFISTHDAPGSESFKGTFSDSSVKSIEPVRQYSKTEAGAIAHLIYTNERVSNFFQENP